TVTVEACRATGNKQKYYSIVMTDVIIAAVESIGQAQSEDNVPLENVKLSYGTISWTYTQTDADGKAKGNVQAGWSLEANKPM
ncbi:MAG: type VI secretion system tube protein Hcp, partial [Planctomycetia bacterium]